MRIKTIISGSVATLLVSILLMGCTGNADFGGLDTAAWKADGGGCGGQRAKQVAHLEEARSNLYGLSNREIMKTLGRPDAEELREGSQRVFLYYTEPGPHCQERNKISASRKVYLRFNALNQVSELTYSHPYGEMIAD